VNSICRQLDIPKKKSADLLESLLEMIQKNLENGEDVLISGFGKFCVKSKNARKGRNPATGEDLMLGSRRVITFKCSPILRARVNSKGE
jgi:integration host factor subunit alpha